MSLKEDVSRTGRETVPSPHTMVWLRMPLRDWPSASHESLSSRSSVSTRSCCLATGCNHPAPCYCLWGLSLSGSQAWASSGTFCASVSKAGVSTNVIWQVWVMSSPSANFPSGWGLEFCLFWAKFLTCDVKVDPKGKSEREDWEAYIQPSCPLCLVLGCWKELFSFSPRTVMKGWLLKRGLSGMLKDGGKKIVVVPYAWEQQSLRSSLRQYVLKHVFWVVVWGRVYIFEMQHGALDSLLLPKGSNLVQVWDFQSLESSSHWLLFSASSIKYISKDKSFGCHHISLCKTSAKRPVSLLQCILWMLACPNMPQ